nr:DUF1501 domain-containing protein [Tuwongella immobilis]
MMMIDSANHRRVMPPGMTRRDWLRRCGMGIGGIGLLPLLESERTMASESVTRLTLMAARPPHFPGKAKRIVHLFMNGGPSQVDTFDPKPLLAKYHGQALPQSFRTERKTGAAFQSPFRFRPYGQSGLAISELFQEAATRCADELCVIRSMHADVPNHEPSLLLMNCGDSRLPRPSYGAWITYGLGSENQNLPGFVVMCPGGYPVVGTQNWRAAFLPGAYQGTYLDTQYAEVEKLIENIRNRSLSRNDQRGMLDLTQAMNAEHRAERSFEPMLDARIQSFELAYRMQMEASDVFDLSREPTRIRDWYGHHEQGRQLLIARRMLERGVRVVQLWSGAGQPWDSHENLANQHRTLARQWDRPIAAFLQDLKQRGLLDSTLVMWGGEFGRTPVAELPNANGRDHNHYGFSMWLAGGGVRGGMAYGATDEFGFRAVENPVHVHDLHATMLHLLGFDHERLTYRFSGRDFRLTEVHGQVISGILA